MTNEELKDFLDFKVSQYNKPSFIEFDPISIPHQFSIKEDIEISAFLTATISWGNRKAILKAANELMSLMGNSPFDFIMNSNSNQISRVSNYYYRTFKGSDLGYFILSLKNIYENHGGLELIFSNNSKDTLHDSITTFRSKFFELPHFDRTRKHVSNPDSGSAAKRLHMMLRWLVRKDNKGVDFGIWKNISPSSLSIPLDLHSGNTARKLGLLKRKQNDLKAVMELDSICRYFDQADPAKYDFALFGLGVNEQF
ncbi:MAG: hypothetical protein RJA53_1408 [Bacteroidota bacterium]|jgi:uncharacterized protein (TIGR02757 family)